MNKCVVIGSGGHSRSLCSVLMSSNEFEPLIVIDLEFAGQNEEILGLRVQGVQDSLPQDLGEINVQNVFLAIGNNKRREELFMVLKKKGFLFPNLIASTAIIKGEVKLGAGNIVFENAYIGPLSKIGDNNIINTGSIVEHECQIGSHCNIGPATVISGRSKISDHVYMGSSSTVIDRIAISSHVTLGAGSVIIKDIAEPGIYVGVPGKKIQ